MKKIFCDTCECELDELDETAIGRPIFFSDYHGITFHFCDIECFERWFQEYKEEKALNA